MKFEGQVQPKRILFVTHYYPPECNAPARRISELAQHWAKAGRSVSVVTGMPNHPHGILPAEYRGAWYRREATGGAVIHRGRIYPAANKGIMHRTLNYLSFCVSAVVTGILKAGPADCVIATSPQLFSALAGWVLSVVKRAQFVFEVRDVWPEEIVAVGAIRNRPLIRILELLEMFLYRRADRIIAVAEGTITILASRGIPREKMSLVPNGVDTSAFVPGPADVRLRASHSLNGEFVVSYIGTVGMAHHLEVVLETASLLRNNADIKFLMVGDGAERARLESECLKRKLDNVTWAPAQPANRIADYYRASDACLVHLRKTDLFTKNIPSKIYEIMACGRPILMGTEGESLQLGRKAGCAQPFAPESAPDLLRAIMTLVRNPSDTHRLGRSGRDFAVQHCDRKQLAEQYLGIVDAVAIGSNTGIDHNSQPNRQEGAHA